MISYLPAKQILQNAGIKATLIRLKVIDALRKATTERARVPIKTLHGILEQTGTPISRISVGQVLRGLVASGLVARDGRGFYKLGTFFSEHYPE
ncbi:Fe2+ or Zn2+ uptake regulation protein [Azomonas macrocytogenes]|uniref:Fe2+ or Zn2+ uptake regulation protein n=1 Tax=Azomonas macrocytogenes TaxID=69962 RepID=A0A839TAB1_AZOMA|nr:Fe2+ or Zn2+ uptake regulation protein [Azomonas macrocytogenes]